MAQESSYIYIAAYVRREECVQPGDIRFRHVYIDAAESESDAYSKGQRMLDMNQTENEVVNDYVVNLDA